MFGYIGTSLGAGLGLYGALPKKKKPAARRLTLFLVGLFLVGFAIFMGRENIRIEGALFGLLTGVIQMGVIGALAAILFTGASGTVVCTVLGLIAGVIVGPYVGVRMDLGMELAPGWTGANALLLSLAGGLVLTGVLCAGAGFLTGTFLQLYRDGRGPFFCIVFLLGGLLNTGCTPVQVGDQPAEPLSPTPADVDPLETPSPAPVDLRPSATPLPTLPVAGIDPESEVVFTIVNEEPATGVAGAPVPDWLAWGAPAFTVAPDGSFWILDVTAAHPPRLVQYSPEGVLRIEISLEGLVTGAVDIAVGETIWVLDTASQPARVVSFDASGQLLDTVEIPEALFEQEGLYVTNLLDDLQVGEGGELLLSGPASPDLYEFLDKAGEITARRLEGSAHGGHLYRTEHPNLVIVDNHSIEIDPVTPDGSVIGVDLLGVRLDGGFYAAVTEEQVQAGQTTGYLRVVHAYTLDGEQLGISLPPESAVWVESNRDLAIGTDGALYALVSQEDHSVDVLRLGFAPELSVSLEPVRTPTPSSTPLTPLLPAWVTPPPDATDLEIARNTLLAFFAYLHDGRYMGAAPLYGGPLDAVGITEPGSPPDDLGPFWEQACLLLQCLQVANIVEEDQVAPDQFRFLVEFMWDDGTLFVLGPCCGATEADMPPVWRFPYTVKVVEGRYVVMEPPQYVP